MNLISKKCDFCNTRYIDVFNITLISNLKKSLILSKEYPILCSKCFRTYSKVKELETYLAEKDITCPECSQPFLHYECAFDGNGNSAYCYCKHCKSNHALILHDDSLVELKLINHLDTHQDYNELIS
ncbi:MAG: hypothetical protein ACFFAS_13855 [Promethearchaeota archaeon]